MDEHRLTTAIGEYLTRLAEGVSDGTSGASRITELLLNKTARVGK